MAGQQHRRHRQFALRGRQDLGPAVVRTVEQALLEAVLQVRLLVAQHAGHQARDGVQQGQRRQFPAGQHEVAQAQLDVHMAVDDALVQALVAAAQQRRAGAVGPLAHQRLVDAATSGCEQHDGACGHARIRARARHRDQRALQRLGQHHHARAAAERAVVDAAVGALGVVAQGPQLHVDLARFVGAARDALRQERREQVGEQRDDVEAHSGFRKTTDTRRSPAGNVSSPGPSRP